MMDGLRQYLLSVTAAALLTAILQAILPPSPVRRVMAFVCALLMFLVILRPLNQLNGQMLMQRFDAYMEELSAAQEEMTQTSAALTESVIISRSAAYIESEAEKQGIACRAEVSCHAESGVSIPTGFVIHGALTQAQQAAVKAVIAESFGTQVQVTFTKEE